MSDCNSTFVGTVVEKIYTKGEDGKDGVGIQSVVANEDASITVTLTDGTIQTTEPLIDTSYSGVYSSTEW